MTEMNHNGAPEVMLYDDIPRYCDHARPDRPYTFLLSPRQAQLYRKKLEHDLMPSRDRSPIRLIVYAWTVANMLFTCRYLFLLGHFHEFYANDLRAITFEDAKDGILIKTNPPRPRSLSQ